MSKKKKILIYVNYLVHLKFYLKFRKSFRLMDYEMVFISNKLSLFVYSKLYNIKLYLIKKCSIENKREILPIVNDSFEIAAELLTSHEAIHLYNSVKKLAEKITYIENIEVIFVFNGTNIADLAIKEIAKKRNIAQLYFELSNIPGKIFIDHKGVNAKSSLFENIDVLGKFIVPTEEYMLWKKKYINYKFRETTAPQGKQKNKINNILLPLDYFGYKLLGIPHDKKEKYFKKLVSKFIYPTNAIIFDNYQLSKKDYLFLPLQVNDDSQILLNSDINNFQAIEYASILAKKKNLKLLVKPHPAELQKDFFNKLLKMKNIYKFYIIDYNTFDLLNNAQLVITINSTVGLEAMILKKEVIFLGRTFYSKLNFTYLKNYLLKYLFDVDFFSKEDIDLLEAEKIINFSRKSF